MRTLFLCLLSICFVTGCGGTHYVYVTDRYPILSKPDRPVYKLSEDPSVGELARVALLWQTYADQLEIAIDTYNEYALQKNEANTPPPAAVKPKEENPEHVEDPEEEPETKEIPAE